MKNKKINILYSNKLFFEIFVLIYQEYLKVKNCSLILIIITEMHLVVQDLVRQVP